MLVWPHSKIIRQDHLKSRAYQIFNRPFLNLNQKLVLKAFRHTPIFLWVNKNRASIRVEMRQHRVTSSSLFILVFQFAELSQWLWSSPRFDCTCDLYTLISHLIPIQHPFATTWNSLWLFFNNTYARTHARYENAVDYEHQRDSV